MLDTNVFCQITRFAEENIVYRASILPDLLVHSLDVLLYMPLLNELSATSGAGVFLALLQGQLMTRLVGILQEVPGECIERA